MKNKRKFLRMNRTNAVGVLFVLPFLIGFIFLFFKPMLASIIYSFNVVGFDEQGMTLKFVGLDNYRYALFSDAEFLKELLAVAGSALAKVVVIMFMSMFVAMLLNQKFYGRLFFRTVLFLPVIFGADVILAIFAESDAYTMLSGTSNSLASVGKEANVFLEELMRSFGFSSGMMNALSSNIRGIFDLTWEMGIQTVLFIVGFQTIPPHLYEVCEMEGATKWETFWKVTFPLLSPTILLCLIYTVIDTFNSDNNVVRIISANMAHLLHYACAQTWLYTLIVFAFVMTIYGLVSRKTIYLD